MTDPYTFAILYLLSVSTVIFVLCIVVAARRGWK